MSSCEVSNMRQVGAETRPGVFHNFTRPSRVAQVKIAVIGQNVRGGRATDLHRGPDTNGQEEWEPIWPNNEGVKVKGEGRPTKGEWRANKSHNIEVQKCVGVGCAGTNTDRKVPRIRENCTRPREKGKGEESVSHHMSQNFLA